jgi:hypothetical protein
MSGITLGLRAQQPTTEIPALRGDERPVSTT